MLTIKRQLYSVDTPRVMAIINITPDSFAMSCRSMTEDEVLSAAALALSQGADILDIGGCSTRPDSTPIDEAEEWRRVSLALRVIRTAFPDAVLSVDTFRASVAQQAIEQFGADIINDVSGGTEQMWEVMAKHNVPYILTHSRPITHSDGVCDVLDFLVRQADRLHQMGVRDVMIDPGFGFHKTAEQNYHLLAHLHDLTEAGLPIVVGLSRKSMVYQTLGTTPNSDQTLLGTTALQMTALEQGAAILRVHDVQAARQTIQLYQTLTNNR